MVTAAARSRASSVSLVYGFSATVLAVLLAAVVPLFLLNSTPDHPGSITIVLSIGILSYAGCRLAFVIGRGEPELFDFVMWLFIYAFIGLPLVAQILHGVFPSTTPGVAEDLVPEAVALIAVSLPLLEMGRSAGRRRARAIAARADHVARVISLSRAAWLAAFGLGVSALYTSRVGAAVFLSNRQTLSDARAAAFGDATSAAIVSALATLPLLVAVHAIVIGNRRRKADGEPPRFRILALLSLLALLFEVNIATSSRYMLGTVVLSLVVLLGFFATRVRARMTMLGVTAVVLIGFPYFGALNRTATSNAADALTGIDALVQSGDYDSFAQIVNSIQVAATQGFSPQQLLGPVLFWVPRSMWSTKPVDTGVLIGEAKGYFFTNLSAPLWAEGYIAAGWFGALAIIGLLGYIIGRSSVPLIAHIHENGPLAISGAILSFYLMILIRGSLLQASATLAVILLSVLWVSVRAEGPPRFGVARNPSDNRWGRFAE